MKLRITDMKSRKTSDVEGSEARATLKSALTTIGESILIPEPPFTGIVRRQALDALRRGETIFTHKDAIGQPSRKEGIGISLPIKIVGIIKHDGSYEKVGDGPDENPFAQDATQDEPTPETKA